MTNMTVGALRLLLERFHDDSEIMVQIDGPGSHQNWEILHVTQDIMQTIDKLPEPHRVLILVELEEQLED